jgi:hypothetical protein
MPIFRRKASTASPSAATRPAPGPKPQPASVPVDNLVGIPEAHRFRAELAAGRWQEFHDFLQATTDWDERHFYVLRLCDISGRPAWIDEWVKARPDSALPLLFRGSHGVNWAWEARGGGRANTVKEDAWPLFHARLVDADRDLARAAALDERDPSPLARAIWVAMGLSLGQQEIRRRFAEAERRQHLNASAIYGMVQALARKWYGSHEEMFDFARWVRDEAPDGHPAHKAIALAHLEGWLDEPEETTPQYFLAEAVRAEIRTAADRSIRSPAYVGGKLAAIDRNAFAMCFFLMRDYDAQLEQMRLIGPHVTSAPWQYMVGTPGQAYERARQAAMQATARPGDRTGRPSL